MEPITPGQALRGGAETATWLHRANLPKNEYQQLMKDRARMEEVERETVDVWRRHLLVNPYPDKIVAAAWNYPPTWAGMTGWEEQLAVLRTFLPGLNPDGLSEMAKAYLEQEDLWRETFEREGYYSQPCPLLDGLVVFALPGRAAAKLGIGDLWADVAKERKGRGLWGKLCEEIVFPQFTLPAENPKFPGFWNGRQGQMNSDRFLPEESAAQWFQNIEGQVKGDFACLPFSSGRRLAGYAVVASRWEAENLLDGLASPAWITSQALITNPGRLPEAGILAIDAGDMCCFGGAREFADAPYFSRGDGKLEFSARHVERPSGSCGTAFVRR